MRDNNARHLATPLPLHRRWQLWTGVGVAVLAVVTAAAWIRLPADDRDVRARVARLSSRADTQQPAPEVDGDGLLRYRSRWVALSPVESALAITLVDRFGAVVGRDTLARRAWPDGTPTRNALDVHMLRLRRRIASLGVEVRTVRSRGYLMQAAQPRADAQ